MEKKIILIAETHKEQIEFIKNSIKDLSDKITILDTNPANSKEMYDTIINLKPNIVITNEQKSDYPATDVIKQIQSNIELPQPCFLIISGFNDIPQICFLKDIKADFLKKPFSFNLIKDYVLKVI